MKKVQLAFISEHNAEQVILALAQEGYLIRRMTETKFSLDEKYIWIEFQLPELNIKD